jgi:hypothetical protein
MLLVLLWGWCWGCAYPAALYDGIITERPQCETDCVVPAPAGDHSTASASSYASYELSYELTSTCRTSTTDTTTAPTCLSPAATTQFLTSTHRP